MKRNTNEIIWRFLTAVFLMVFLYNGIITFRDYGAASDEINQIEAGHITWTAVCERLGKEPPDFGNLPKLKDYYNRYYGQAATFPTVIIEALKGFSLDVSTVLRLRHLWNFLVYFSALVCLGILIKLHHKREDVVFFLLLMHILAPRLFGETFINDRDVMLVSLMWISLLSYELFTRRPGILTALLCGAFFALAVNTRFFALVLVLLPLFGLICPDRQKRRYNLVLIGSAFFFWYLFTPLFWGNLIPELTAAFRTFATGEQRTQETGGMASILFFGKHYPENALPIYYLPVWIFISTPLIPQILAAVGLTQGFRSKADRMDRFMSVFLCLGILAVMLIRPVLYNGWRHMYFFYVPIFWFTADGLNIIFSIKEKIYSRIMICLILISAVWSASRIIALHPYEYVYLNPLFQNRLADFDRDYWRLSTRECLEWLDKQEAEKFSVGETNESLDNALIALLPEVREKISIRNYNALHRVQPDYLIYNYSDTVGNSMEFPLYEQIHAVERDGTKLAEIYRRHPGLHTNISQHTPAAREIIDGDLSTEWRSDTPQNPEDSLIIEFTEPTILTGLSLAPGDDEREYARSPEVSISPDGETWEPLPLTVSGLFDLSFPQTTTKWLRIRNTEPADVHWSVREIYFY
ncbi:MAG: discoidin domain-containing protein [Flexilinea sp.]|nr:discoidin domain-containing protein [Flexilinea sp.]